MKTKAYTIRGANGAQITLSESEAGYVIVVTVRDAEGAATVRLDADQFTTLMGLGSIYDGLKVRSAEVQPVPA